MKQMPIKESEEQAALFEWAAWNLHKYPELDLLLHIPNGGSRHPAEAANLKRQGVKSGVPDLFLPVPRGVYHGLFIELKTAKGKLSGNQEKWLERLNNNGYYAVMCRGWEQARDIIIKYLGN